jgi:hypothetical protein
MHRFAIDSVDNTDPIMSVLAVVDNVIVRKNPQISISKTVSDK